MRRVGLIPVVLLAATCFAQQGAAQTAGWRTDGTGEYPNATPPIEWSATKNVIWSTPLPKFSNASPVLMDGLLFCCADPNVLMCLDAATGKILWSKANLPEDAATPEQLEKFKEVKTQSDPLQKEGWKLNSEMSVMKLQLKKTPDDADLKKKLEDAKKRSEEITAKLHALKPFMPPEFHPEGGYAMSTPVADGKNVYAVFATGIVVAYDTKGNRLWARFIETPTMHWGHSSSPLLSGGKLIVPLNELTAFDPETGKTLWTAKCAQTHGTPVEFKIGDTPALLTASGQLVRVSDGQVMTNGLGYMQYCSPIVHDGVGYLIDDAKHAFKLPTEPADTFKPETLWQHPIKYVDRYYASPLFYEGLIYAITAKGKLTVFDAKTGATVYTQPIFDDKTFGDCYSSITLAGKYIYICSSGRIEDAVEHTQTTLIIQPGREFKEVARNTLETFRTSPVFDGKRMYIRTLKAMYCIGE